MKYKISVTRKISLYLLMVLLLCSCEKTMEYYYGIPMQPKFFESSDWQKVINVFGILRPDSAEIPMSFVFLQKTFPTKGAKDEDNTITNAIVNIYSTSPSGVKDTIELNYYKSPDTTTWSFPRYISEKLKPQAGTTYKLECLSPELPKVTCEATVPFIPKIDSGSLVKDMNHIEFSIAEDSLTFLYDMYLFSDNDMITKRFVHIENSSLQVNWQYERKGNWNLLAIYAYDKNMASYLTTATNSFYNFNSYRPALTTVTGGFGVFGAMNYLIVKLGK